MVIFLINTSITFAHSGRTDASGCHTNRSTGEFHCNNGTSRNENYSNHSSASSTNYEYQYKDNDQWD
ncbi:YHYH domain-containing protein [Neobacillus drentensis]|uniref:YHYH domain-containing protein n=1 Tax=Neobacillus drentensis TaxID=220684 RepID=UPI003B588A93